MTKKMKEEMKLATTALRPRWTPSAKCLKADAMRVCGITISLKDSLCLNHGKWLNDTIIDAFILLIKQAQREISSPSYNNWLMPLSLLQQMYQHSFECVKQYTSNERIRLQDFDAVIFIVVMKPKSKTLEVYDSLRKKVMLHSVMKLTPLLL
jgi:Ulp1 family protease